MEDFKITVDFRNSSGKKISFEYDLDVIDPYLESLFGFFIDLDEEQERKNVFENFMAEMIKAKNLEKTDKDNIDAICKQLNSILNDSIVGTCDSCRIDENASSNTRSRDANGRFVKKNSKKK